MTVPYVQVWYLLIVRAWLCMSLCIFNDEVTYNVIMILSINRYHACVVERTTQYNKIK